MKGLLTSKTMFGVLLGILGVLFDAVEIAEVPELVARIFQVAGFIITAMGLRDSMLQQKESLIRKIIDFKSKTFWGVLIEAVVHLTEVGDTLAIPEELKLALRLLGAVAIAIGLRDAAQRSRK